MVKRSSPSDSCQALVGRVARNESRERAAAQREGRSRRTGQPGRLASENPSNWPVSREREERDSPCVHGRCRICSTESVSTRCNSREAWRGRGQSSDTPLVGLGAGEANEMASSRARERTHAAPRASMALNGLTGALPPCPCPCVVAAAVG
ncbi:hypothetical protein BJY59DRAFT_38914 [Rhodotorula toruloides]